jgi:hypothetical protein
MRILRQIVECISFENLLGKPSLLDARSFSIVNALDKMGLLAIRAPRWSERDANLLDNFYLAGGTGLASSRHQS